MNYHFVVEIKICPSGTGQNTESASCNMDPSIESTNHREAKPRLLLNWNLLLNFYATSIIARMYQLV